MCGLVFGYCFNKQNQQSFFELIEHTVECMSHRGGDDSGLYVDRDQGYVLGHTRLSLNGGMAGSQPVTCDGASLVYNGEIYSYKKTSVFDLGFSSDTQFLFQSLQSVNFSSAKNVSNFLSSLDGMWSFVCVKGDNLILSRCFFGQKPLYVITHKEFVIFTSDVEAVDQSFKDFGAYSCRKVSEFPAGSFLLANISHFSSSYFKEIKPEPFYSLESASNCRPAYGFSSLFSSVIDCYSRGVVGDIAVSLSGGLDSSLIAASLVRALGCDRVKAFHAHMGSHNNLDLKNAAYVANKLNIEFIDVEVTPKLFLKELGILKDKLTVDIFSPAVVLHSILLRKVKERNIKIIYEGQGADEYLGGYIQDQMNFNMSHLNSLISKLKFIAKSIYHHKMVEIAVFFKNYTARKNNTHFDIVSNNIFHSPLPQLLSYGDWISMLHNIENRLPFLSPNLVFQYGKFNTKELYSYSRSKYPVRDMLFSFELDRIASFKKKRGYELDWFKLYRYLFKVLILPSDYQKPSMDLIFFIKFFGAGIFFPKVGVLTYFKKSLRRDYRL